MPTTLPTNPIHHWQSEQIQRFWDYESHFPENYWGRNCAKGFLALVGKHLQRAQRVLDLGCGDGALIEAMLPFVQNNTQAKLYGLDLSQQSVAKANARLQGQAGFAGAFDALPALLAHCQGGFDVVLCTEVVEHLYDPALQALLADAKQLLAPHGTLIITTPNNENLQAGMVCNPLDGSLFHRWQHVRSWTTQSLSATLEQHGLRVSSTLETNVLWYNAGWLKNLYRRLRYRTPTTLMVHAQRA